MAVTFKELNGLADMLGGGRHELYFPNLPVGDSRALMLTNSQVALPAKGVGHIKAKLLGHSIGFRGGLSFDNTLSCTFKELSNGLIIKTLASWLHTVRNPDNGTSLLKSQYAVNGTLKVLNTIGEPAFEADLINVFPVMLTFPELSADATTQVEVQATFNVDRVSIQGKSSSLASLYQMIGGV